MSGAVETVVVGPSVPTSRAVRFTREEPPGGGPAAALLHSLDHFGRRPAIVVALAVDMPLVGAGTVERLLAAVTGDPGIEPPEAALLADGHRQPLCAAYRTAALLAAAPDVAARTGLSMRALVAGLRLVLVPARGAEAADVDTWDDLRRIRAERLPDDR